jgi:hypothetical protein
MVFSVFAGLDMQHQVAIAIAIAIAIAMLYDKIR